MPGSGKEGDTAVGLSHMAVGRHDGLTITTLRWEERKVGLPCQSSDPVEDRE